MNFAKKTPQSTVMEITPDIAEEMLKSSSGNRPIRPSHVRLLSAAMRRGEWRVISNGIGFDLNGKLRDGHHRLTACIQSGVTFRSLVLFGMCDNAYEVTDTGVQRTYADRLNEDRRVSDVLSLGCQYALSNTKPSIDQMRPIIDAGLGEAARSLVEHCGWVRKYYSSAPMKLAACATIMNGDNSSNTSFVLQQYKSLCGLDFGEMYPSAHALVRQVDAKKASANVKDDTLARGLIVFDYKRRGLSRITIGDEEAKAAVEFVRTVLRRSIAFSVAKKPFGQQNEWVGTGSP